MSRIRVLIAEDEPAVREALAELIRGDDSLELVGTAPHAEAAVELARAHRPDVALVDVKMPGGGGQAAARRIRQECPQTRVLALSAYDDRASVMEMVRAGAVGYLVKGTAPGDILEAIRASAEGRGTLSPQVTGEVITELAGQLERQALEDEERLHLLDDVRRVLGGHGLRMVFQPIADLDSGRTVGVEALARYDVERWPGPERSFWDAASVGLQVELELAAVREALRALPRLPADRFLSVNLSPATAASPRFLDALGEVPGHRVVMEITEHARVEDYERMNEALGRLRGRGLRLAIDDAGAGFASLQHIVRLAPDFIKLDMALTRDIDRDPVRRALATALISFATETGAALIAEGIETGGECETLRALGVPYGQGYYLARPGPLPAELPTFDFSSGP